MDNQQLLNIALSFRKAIQIAKRKHEFYNRSDRMNNFPSGCCDDSSDLFGYYLLVKYHIHSEQGNGVYRDGNPHNTTNHAWLILSDGTVIDLTADQFPYFVDCPNGIYVGSKNRFYENLDDVYIQANYDISQNLRLWNDYKAICKYLDD